MAQVPKPSWIKDPDYVDRLRAAIERAGFPDREWPRITVVTPAYKSAKYIRDTIESVRLQFYPNLEYIVRDNCSPDGTREILEEYDFFRAVIEPDKGQADALNRSFAESSGEILTWLNADDLFAPFALFRMALAFMQGDADLVAGQVVLFQNDTAINRHTYGLPAGPLVEAEILDLAGMWNTGQYFYQPEVFFTRDIYDRAGGFVNEDLFFSMDYELWLRMAGAGARIRTIAAPIVLFRKHDEQKTHDVSGFKTELKDLVAGYARKTDTPPRFPGFKWNMRQPKVVMINDLGFQYGAGIGHRRIAKALRYMGCEVHAFCLSEDANPANYDSAADHEYLVSEILRLDPDAVMVGNLHGSEKRHAWLHHLLDACPVFFVTHDFYWLTGRCAYFGTCTKYQEVRCDDNCPTFFEYPDLAPELVSASAREKDRLLRHPNAHILANSDYSAGIARQTLKRRGLSDEALARKVFTAHLGADAENYFLETDTAHRTRMRQDFGLPTDRLIVLMPSGNYTDPRKNGQAAWRAFSRLPRNRFHALVLGQATLPPASLGGNVTALPYLKDADRLSALFRCSDFVFNASRDETFGQTIVEGAMSGAVPVSIGAGAVPELIARLGCGFQSAPEAGEDAAIAAAARFMIDLAADPVALAGARLTCALSAVSAFSLEGMTRELHVVLKQAGIIAARGLMPKVDLQLNSSAPEVRLVPRWDPERRTREIGLLRQEIETLRQEIETQRGETAGNRTHIEAADRLKHVYKALALAMIEEMRHAIPALNALYDETAADLYGEAVDPDDPRLGRLIEILKDYKTAEILAHSGQDSA